MKCYCYVGALIVYYYSSREYSHLHKHRDVILFEHLISGGWVISVLRGV